MTGFDTRRRFPGRLGRRLVVGGARCRCYGEGGGKDRARTGAPAEKLPGAAHVPLVITAWRLRRAAEHCCNPRGGGAVSFQRRRSAAASRSGERRVREEGRSRWSPES